MLPRRLSIAPGSGPCLPAISCSRGALRRMILWSSNVNLRRRPVDAAVLPGRRRSSPDHRAREQERDVLPCSIMKEALPTVQGPGHDEYRARGGQWNRIELVRSPSSPPWSSIC